MKNWESLELITGNRFCFVCRNFMNDSFRTDVFVRYSPETIGCTCIFLSARQLGVGIIFSLFLVKGCFSGSCCTDWQEQNGLSLWLTTNKSFKMECVHSRDQRPYWSFETKGRFCIKIEFNSQKIGLLLQHGRCSFVLLLQHGYRDVMWTHSIHCVCVVCHRFAYQPDHPGGSYLVQS